MGRGGIFSRDVGGAMGVRSRGAALRSVRATGYYSVGRGLVALTAL